MKKLRLSNPGSNRPRIRTPLGGLAGLCAAICFFPSYVFHTPKAIYNEALPTIILKAQQVAGNLQAPTDIAFPGNGDIWITEQTGKIRVIKNGKLSNVPLIDLGSKLPEISTSYDERGLLGIALHPQFKSNGKFYVFYSRPSGTKSDHTDVVAEYKLQANSNHVDPGAGRIILAADKPDGNHNGGCIKFGPDGYLYVSFGDGGGQGDRHGEFGNGQKMDTWLGKILRVDVNTNSGYLIPKSNPFVGKKNMNPEIWAYGFRNPYRFSFDKASGELFAGDVGQNAWEEIDMVSKGANYGWRLMEGNHCYTPATGCSVKGITLPIAEYSHKEGISVIGGYIYNGARLPVLKSKYVFADWIGKVFYLNKTGNKWVKGNITLQNIPENLKITGFGEDPAGELYVLTSPDTGPGNIEGSIYKL